MGAEQMARGAFLETSAIGTDENMDKLRSVLDDTTRSEERIPQ